MLRVRGSHSSYRKVDGLPNKKLPRPSGDILVLHGSRSLEGTAEAKGQADCAATWRIVKWELQHVSTAG